MEVLSSGVLKVLPQHPQRVLTLDDGVSSNVLTPNHYIRSSDLAARYPYEAEN